MILGLREFENKYGRLLFLRTSIICLLDVVYPPVAPPRDFPSVEFIISI